MSEVEQRKIEHVEIVARDAAMDRQKSYFDAIRLTHRALPELSLAEVDPSVVWFGKRLRFPFLISSMTGGRGKLIHQINHNLACAAEAEGVAMGVGSQRVMLLDPAARASFELRAVAPNALLFANLGAVQLNEGVGLDQIGDAMGALDADALILHLNPLQEAIQPEGDIHFGGLCEKIGEVVRALDRPVIVKEVGAGLSRADAERLVAAGVQTIDVAGTGGTSWSRIEAARSADPSLGACFQDWGIPTPDALRALADLKVRRIASGGIRTGIDMVKAMVLGASLCGMARPLLEPAMDSVEAVRALIRRRRREFVTAMFLLGAKNVDSLRGRKELLS